MSPRRQERLFETRYGKELLSIAFGDLATAKALRGLPNVRIENAFYLAQQAIEKALKAVLVNRGIPVPMVHDLGSLLGKLPSDCEPPYGYELNELNQYATVRRYETGAWQPSDDELAAVLDKAAEILAWAAGIVAAS